MQPMQNSSATHRLGQVLIVLYLVSGAASLAYEILWTRMLSLQFGVSIFGVVVTVTAYMAGLGLGSIIGARWNQISARPLRLFALLELSVACSAIIIPELFQLLDAKFSTLAGNVEYSTWLTLQIVVVLFVLMIPAFAMGMGFPMILAAVQNTRVTLGGIYGINAIGGALGALLPLWLLPNLGWLLSLRVVAALGFVVAAIAYGLSLRYETQGAGHDERRSAPLVRPPLKWLLTYAGIGAAALLLEIGWTRLFGMVMLRTEYVLAIILAVFLLGIGLGSLLARYLTQRIWFTLLPVIASSFAVLSLWWLPGLSAWLEQGRFPSLAMALWQQGWAVVSLTLPVTLVLGAWLPLLAERLGDRYHSGVWLYGANSLGAAAGALMSAFVLIPAIGSSATIILGALILLVLGLSWGAGRWAWVSVPVLAVAAMPVYVMPSVSALMPHAYGKAKSISLEEDAISITHVVEDESGQRQLLADLRRMDASSDPTAVVVQMNQVRLPLLLHPEPHSVLLLGLGTGISASASLALPELERTAVELSGGAIHAAQQDFAAVNQGVTGKLRIVRDDARHFLLSDRQQYDVIIGDLFHPDLVGRSALLSRQQFARARQRLADGGVFVQWLALNQFDVANLQVVLHTFQQVFPDAVMFVDAFRLAMVGVRAGDISSRHVLHNIQRLSKQAAEKLTGGEGAWTWLGRYWGAIPVLNTPLQDEWAPVIEYQLPGARYDGGLDLSRVLSWLLAQRPAMAQAEKELALVPADVASFEPAYAATELAHRSWLALLQQRPREGQRLLPLAYQANPRDRWIGFALADAVLEDRAAAQARGLDKRQLLGAVLRIRPDHTEALRGLWHLAEAAGDQALARQYRQRFAALSPLDAELRVSH